VNGLRLRRVGRRTHREVDAAGLEERLHAVEPRLAVDVLVVVRRTVERLERLIVPLGPVAQEVVEHLLPRAGVDLRRLGQDAVEVEQAGGDSGGHVEHLVDRLPAPVARGRGMSDAEPLDSAV